MRIDPEQFLRLLKEEVKAVYATKTEKGLQYFEKVYPQLEAKVREALRTSQKEEP